MTRRGHFHRFVKTNKHFELLTQTCVHFAACHDIIIRFLAQSFLKMHWWKPWHHQSLADLVVSKKIQWKFGPHNSTFFLINLNKLISQKRHTHFELQPSISSSLCSTQQTKKWLSQSTKLLLVKKPMRVPSKKFHTTKKHPWIL